MTLMDRGAKLECGTRKAAHSSAAQKEEAGNTGFEDYQYPYEGSSQSNLPGQADQQGIDFSKDYER